MLVLQWATSQIFSYSIASWMGFIVVTFVMARFLRIPGIILGHIAVAVAVAALDVRWVQAEMSRPGWDPNVGPDQDFVFVIGVLLRIVIINAVLLPVSLIGLWLPCRHGGRLVA